MMIKSVKYKKITLGIVSIFLLISLIACQAETQSTIDKSLPGRGIKISTAHSTWIGERFQTEIVNIGLEKLGYKVSEPKEIEYPPIYISLANGDLDYGTIGYFPGHQAFFNNAGGEENLERVGVLTPKGIQGYQIDKKTADKYNITNIEQLQKPEIAKLFDSDKDGKANLAGCNPGWACELNIDHHIKTYGLQDTIEHDQGQYVALLANSITRYKQGEPVLLYAYNPHWIGAVLKQDEDVVWLEVPFTSLPKGYENLTEKDTSVDGKNLGFPRSKQQIVGNKKFLAANPVAKRWFELVQISLEDMNAENLRIKDGENRLKDIRRHASEWIEKNQEHFDCWLAEAKQTANLN